MGTNDRPTATDTGRPAITNGAPRPRVVRIVLANPKALRALGYAAGVLNELQEDLPWRDEPKRAARALKYAMRHLRPEIQKDSEPT